MHRCRSRPSSPVPQGRSRRASRTRRRASRPRSSASSAIRIPCTAGRCRTRSCTRSPAPCSSRVRPRCASISAASAGARAATMQARVNSRMRWRPAPGRAAAGIATRCGWRAFPSVRPWRSQAAAAVGPRALVTVAPPVGRLIVDPVQAAGLSLAGRAGRPGRTGRLCDGARVGRGVRRAAADARPRRRGALLPRAARRAARGGDGVSVGARGPRSLRAIPRETGWTGAGEK